MINSASVWKTGYPVCQTHLLFACLAFHNQVIPFIVVSVVDYLDQKLDSAVLDRDPVPVVLAALVVLTPLKEVEREASVRRSSAEL